MADSESDDASFCTADQSLHSLSSTIVPFVPEKSSWYMQPHTRMLLLLIVPCLVLLGISIVLLVGHVNDARTATAISLHFKGVRYTTQYLFGLSTERGLAIGQTMLKSNTSLAALKSQADSLSLLLQQLSPLMEDMLGITDETVQLAKLESAKLDNTKRPVFLQNQTDPTYMDSTETSWLQVLLETTHSTATVKIDTHLFTYIYSLATSMATISKLHARGCTALKKGRWDSIAEIADFWTHNNTGKLMLDFPLNSVIGKYVHSSSFATTLTAVQTIMVTMQTPPKSSLESVNQTDWHINCYLLIDKLNSASAELLDQIDDQVDTAKSNAVRAVVLIAMGYFLCLILGAALGFAYAAIRHSLLVVQDVTTKIANMDLDSVQPPPAHCWVLEEALYQVVQNLRLFRSFLPESLFVVPDKDTEDTTTQADEWSESASLSDTGTLTPSVFALRRHVLVGTSAPSPQMLSARSARSARSRASAATSSSSGADQEDEGRGGEGPRTPVKIRTFRAKRNSVGTDAAASPRTRTRKPNLHSGLNTRHGTVCVVHLLNWGEIVANMDHDALLPIHNQISRIIHFYVNKHGGVFHHFSLSKSKATCSFNTAQRSISHREDACAFALNVLAKIKRLNDELAEEHLPVLRVGIALVAGMVLCGNVGPKSSKSYAIIGPALDCAYPLAELNSVLNTSVLIDPSVNRAAFFQYLTRLVDVVGIRTNSYQPKLFRVYELVQPKQPLGMNEWMYTLKEQETTNPFAYWEQAYTFFLKGDFVTSMKRLREHMAHNPSDPLSQTLLDQLRDFAPTPQWTYFRATNPTWETLGSE
eukprot:TRINITY_DN54916_c0_g1_i1.p1 TRINITY_DN54916_c0_g1~~TRINITY_DN54916_c0_g1_i1.p1  ORF type:complete len:824 (-),score=92.65 TRINITY_DN54916_c0_g1_i1:143-2590(-)